MLLSFHAQLHNRNVCKLECMYNVLSANNNKNNKFIFLLPL